MNWRDAIIRYVRENAKPIDKFDHQVRLYALTRAVGEGIDYDDDVVFAAAWLHDLGVFVGHRPENPKELERWDNVLYACQKSPSILSELGFPEPKVSAVVEAIRTHQPTSAPTTIEGTLLRDADILEQLGAIAIVRALAKVGRDTRFSTYHEVVPVLEKACRELPGQLHLDSAKHLALPRVQALNAFLEALRFETKL